MMNFEEYRRTGELSDITVIVNGTEFKLHTFPLFTKSQYFKKKLSSLNDSKDRLIDLKDQFPGGEDIFNIIADYLYSIPIKINENNLIFLRSASIFLQCDELKHELEQKLNQLLKNARIDLDLNIPLKLLKQCSKKPEDQYLVEECLQCFIQLLSSEGIGLQLDQSTREIIVQLPVENILQLIDLCPKESQLAILPLIKHYLTIRVLNEENSSEQTKNLLDQIVQLLTDRCEQFPLIWLNSLYEKSLQLNCQCSSILSSCITQSLLNSQDYNENFDKIPVDIMAKVFERIHNNKDEHIKDPEKLFKFTSLVDSYIEQLRERGELTSEQFVRLASCIPKEQRTSHDILLRALNEILKDEKSTQLTSLERDELINQIDFSRVSEETISACKTNKLIPQQLITDAALSLCFQLRTQLDLSETRLRSAERQLILLQPSSSLLSSNFRSRPLENSTYRRSRSNYKSTSSLIRNPLLSSYTSYDVDLDSYPPRYLSSASSSRYSTYRY